jgi:hypothetical protein
MWRTENETLECEASMAHRDEVEVEGVALPMVAEVVFMVRALSSIKSGVWRRLALPGRAASSS